MNRSRYYQAPDNVGIGSLIILVPSGLITSLVLGIIYGIATGLCPFIYINALITWGYGTVLGITMGKVAESMKFPSQVLGTLLTVGIGIVGAYTAWIGWIFYASNWEAIVWHPGHVASIMKEIAAEGGWSIFSFTPQGIVLYLIWLLEAGIILFFTRRKYLEFVSLPYCGHCQQWAERFSLYMPLKLISDGNSLRTGLEAEGYQALDELQIDPQADDQFGQASLFQCERCDNLNVLSINNVKVTVDKEGNASTENEPVVENILVSLDACNRLKPLEDELQRLSEQNPAEADGDTESATPPAEAS